MLNLGPNISLLPIENKKVNIPNLHFGENFMKMRPKEEKLQSDVHIVHILLQIVMSNY